MIILAVWTDVTMVICHNTATSVTLWSGQAEVQAHVTSTDEYNQLAYVSVNRRLVVCHRSVLLAVKIHFLSTRH